VSAALLTALVLAAGTYGLKAAGPLFLGGERTLPPTVERLALLLPAPLLAALIATSTLAEGQRWTIDARVIGLAVAAVALWRRLPFLVVVLSAAAATAAVRAVG
jgi:branched-subunit amino acid transport protein